MGDRTHWDECWRDPAHHGCAVGEIERLREANEKFGLRQEWWDRKMFELEAQLKLNTDAYWDEVGRLTEKASLARDRAEKAEAEVERLEKDNAGWQDGYSALTAEVERLKVKLFSLGAMSEPPCFACGYNGAGYYQPDKHPCAALHHAARGES